MTRRIFVLSDSTGTTAERVVRAALVQFPTPDVKLQLFPRLRDQAAVERALDRARQENAMVVFTVVSPALRDAAMRKAHALGIRAIDIIGAVLDSVAEFLGEAPLGEPGLRRTLSDEYFRRVEALDFAIKSDDGREPDNLKRADIILFGLSRTGKTTLAITLAGHGMKVASVPLVVGMSPPSEVLETEPRRVIGLTISRERLAEVRRTRLERIGVSRDAIQASLRHLDAELAYAEAIFREHPGWLVLDVSGRPVEELASLILEHWETTLRPASERPAPANAGS